MSDLALEKRIVCISGSSRPDNYTSRALAHVATELGKRGAVVETFDGRTLTLGFPGQPETEDARRLQERLRGAAGVVLATPEYHDTFSALTKLILENLGFPSALKGKPVALLGVASGRIGAVKSLEHLRSVCAHVGALVIPTSISVAGVRAAIDPSGTIVDRGTETALTGLAESLLTFLKDYVCPRFVLEAAVRGEKEIPWVTPV